MRIIAGTHRGTALTPVGRGDAAAHLRPTGDRVRESLFNMLAGGRFGDPLTGARVLDLFAGTGALGLEALSRGAAHVWSVDSGKAALRLIRANVARLGRTGDVTVIASDIKALPPAAQGCNLLFLDPPYGSDLGAVALAMAQRKGWIDPGTLIIWEDNRPHIAPPGLIGADQRRYGDSWITILRAEG